MSSNEILKSIKQIFINGIQLYSKIIVFYVGWIILHYVSSHLYTYICTPLTFIGFILSPIQLSSPICIGLRWIIYEAGNLLFKMWHLLGAWIMTKILFYKSE